MEDSHEVWHSCPRSRTDCGQALKPWGCIRAFCLSDFPPSKLGSEALQLISIAKAGNIMKVCLLQQVRCLCKLARWATWGRWRYPSVTYNRYLKTKMYKLERVRCSRVKILKVGSSKASAHDLGENRLCKEWTHKVSTCPRTCLGSGDPHIQSFISSRRDWHEEQWTCSQRVCFKQCPDWSQPGRDV